MGSKSQLRVESFGILQKKRQQLGNKVVYSIAPSGKQNVQGSFLAKGRNGEKVYNKKNLN